jgi:hypothetical protein
LKDHLAAFGIYHFRLARAGFLQFILDARKGSVKRRPAMRSSGAKRVTHAKVVWGQGVAGAPRSIDFKKHAEAGPVSWRDLNRVVFVAAAVGFFWIRGGESHLLFTTVGMICALVGGIPIFQETYRDISNRRTNWPMFLAAAILAALLVGNVFVALVITLFGLVADVIKAILSFRRRRAVQNSGQGPRT